MCVSRTVPTRDARPLSGANRSLAWSGFGFFCGRGWLLVVALVVGSSCSSDRQPAPVSSQPDASSASEETAAGEGQPDEPAPGETPASPETGPAEVDASGAGESEFTVVGLPDVPGALDAVVLFPGGTKAAACGEDGKIQIYEVSSREVVTSFEGHPGAPRLAVSADGKLLAHGSDQDTRVRTWNIEELKEFKTLEGHKLPVSDVAFSPDGSLLATSSRSASSGSDGEIKIWNLAEDSEPVSVEPGSGISAIAFSPDGDYLASAGVAKPSKDGESSEAETVVWDLNTREAKTTFKNGRGAIYQVAFSPDGGTLAFSELNGPSAVHVSHRIRLVDPLTGESKGSLPGHMGEIHGLAFSPDGQFLVSAGQEGLLRIWQVPTMSLRSIRDLNGYGASDVTFSRDGDRFAVAAGRDSSEIHPTVWALEYAFGVEPSPPGWEPFRTRVLKTQTRVQVDKLAYSSDGKRLAFLARAAGNWVYDTTTWSGRRVLNDPRLHFQALSPDVTMASALGDTYQMWNVEEGRMIHDFGEPRIAIDPMTGNTGLGIQADAFSPDGRCLVSAHIGHIIKVRDSRTYDLSAAAFHPEGSLNSIAFSADGSKMATGAGSFRFAHGSMKYSGPVSVWDVKNTVGAKDWQMKASREKIKRDVSAEANAAFAKATRYYEQGGQANRFAKTLQSAVSQFAEIGVSTDPRLYRWQQLSLTPAGDGLDAVRFTVPGDAPVDLMWTFVFTPAVTECRIIPASGRLPDAKERIAFVQFLDWTPTTFQVAVGRVLESTEIQPGQQFIAWFALNTEKPVDVKLAVNTIPQGSFMKEGWAWPIYDRQFANVPLLRRTRLLFHGDAATGVALSPDGSLLASVGKSGLVKLWDIASATVIATISGRVARFSPDGRTLATSGMGEEASSVILWDAQNGRRLRALSGGHLREVTTLAFSPDGKRLASGGRDGLVTVWDPETGEQAWTPAAD